VKVFGDNIKGQSVLLCRYLTQIKPPRKVVDLDMQRDDFYAIEKAARFVSMVPFIDDLTMFQNMPDMYSSCQEFLDLGAGDYEEHAILLANYF
jgi:coiled-coil and C2 domain-containing protein 2A